MTFRVGQKVICIDVDSGPGVWSDNDAPSVGTVYTVLGIHVDEDDFLILRLVEISRGPIARSRYGNRAGYWAARFRPVVDRKTSIEIFTAMLKPQGVDA